MRTQAPVGPAAEREVTVAAPVEVDRVGVVELGVVEVAGAENCPEDAITLDED